jgi:hypothetical protein
MHDASLGVRSLFPPQKGPLISQPHRSFGQDFQNQKIADLAQPEMQVGSILLGKVRAVANPQISSTLAAF